MKIEKPVFIVGIGRCGSTALHHLLSTHPDLCWLSRLCDDYPARPSVNRLLMKAIDYPVIGQVLRSRINPRECYGFWEYYCPGFTSPCRDLVAEDLTPRSKERIQGILPQLLTAKRKRLLVKITGWPRIRLLRELYKDAKFIHILRDGRAVVNSMINTDWWWGWRGPQNWGWGELTSAQAQKWENSNKSFIALAGIQWEIFIAAMQDAKAAVPPHDFLEVKYESLCAEPLASTKEIVEFCNLHWSRAFEDVVRNRPFRNTNYKWQTELSARQQRVLTDVLGESLRSHGYG